MNNVLIQANAEAAEARREANEAQLKGMKMAIESIQIQKEMTKREIEARQFKPFHSPTCNAILTFGACFSCVAVVGYLSYFIWNYGL